MPARSASSACDELPTANSSLLPPAAPRVRDTQLSGKIRSLECLCRTPATSGRRRALECRASLVRAQLSQAMAEGMFELLRSALDGKPQRFCLIRNGDRLQAVQSSFEHASLV